jgi:protein TonB
VSSQRPVVIAAGLSLALHATALLVWGGLGERAVLHSTAVPPPPVQVEVMRLAGIIPSARSTPLDSVREPGPPERSRGTGPRAAQEVPAASAPAVLAAPGAALAEAVAEPAGPASPGSVPAEGAGAAAAEQAAQGDPTREGTGAPGTLDTSALSRRLQEGALRCYPPAARRFRQQGEAKVRFCLDGAGALREAAVAASSGSALLDRAASECVVPGAAPFGPETFGRCFTVPVRFGH